MGSALLTFHSKTSMTVHELGNTTHLANLPCKGKAHPIETSGV